MCANITDELICSGAQLNGTDGDLNALVAGAMKVGGSVYLDSISMTGSPRLGRSGWPARTSPATSLRRRAARQELRRHGPLAKGLRVGGQAFLARGVRHRRGGPAARRGHHRRLSCRAARLGRDQNGNALVADKMRVGGEVHLYEGSPPAGRSC